MRQSFGDRFTNAADLPAHDSVISQQVFEEVRSTVKVQMMKIYISVSLLQL